MDLAGLDKDFMDIKYRQEKSKESLLSVESVSKTYNKINQALQNISLNIEPGIFGLLGPNGAGKSTLMRIIVGLQTADTGKVLFNGCDINDELDVYHQSIGYVPQEFGLYPNITAIKLLDHFARLKGIHHKKERKDIIMDLLEQTNLLQKKDALLGSFSGGMKQRFGLAQALIGKPKLLVIDEPTSGLDPQERYRLLNFLANISKHTAILLSTHIVQDVADLCPKFAIIKAGEIVMQGNPEQATASIDGKIWRQALNQKADSLGKYEQVLSTRFISGTPHIHVLSSQQPSPSFVAIPPSLEDFYFSKVNTNV